MSKKNKGPAQTSDFQVVVTNKKARFSYQILEVIEAGIVLSGNEIKSIRAGGVSLSEAYVRPSDGEIFLIGAHINEYEHSSLREYNPTRSRKLLLHKREIRKLTARVEQRGLTMVPLRLYLKRGRAKVEVGLAKGKAAPDKRRTIIDREKQREAARAMRRG
ncbi:MAG: SsrA-binding protein SmpB [Deltaproteobacteria bacterium]|nr:SsrA-binding protein SmpB [Deltaproteobacteria bacterium]